MAKWGMVIDLDKCTGCQSCSVACKAENNVPHSAPDDYAKRQANFWHKVFTVTEGEYPTVSVNPIPMPCMHCEEAPCTIVCPANATYRREDGIVVQDFRRCIGCRYCVVACPYGVRNFNYKDQPEQPYHRPDLPPDLDSRGPWPFPTRIRGVIEKCTFCFHRIDAAQREGKQVGMEVVTACTEACPAHAIAFGDLEDPESEVSRLLASRNSFRLRDYLHTQPKVYYLPR